MKKRILYTLLFLVLAGLSVLGYARYVEPALLTVKSYDITTTKPIEPMKIVFFTDAHFGKFFDQENVEKIVKKINREEADLVVFGGDLFDNYARDKDQLDLEYLKEELKQIQTTTGKYAVRGNHDYGGGASRIYEEFLTEAGFTILDNESKILEQYNIQLIGYDDYLMGWTEPSLYHINSDRYNIIIAHEPIVSQFIESKSDNLLLSGHTHGGQVTIPFLSSKFLPEGSGEFVKGLYTQDELQTETSLTMITSSGIGMTQLPLRFLNVPEIITINLKHNNQ